MIRLLFVSLILQFQIAAYAAENGAVQIFLGTTQQPPANQVQTNHLILELVTPDGYQALDVVGNDDFLTDSATGILKQITDALYIQGVLN